MGFSGSGVRSVDAHGGGFGPGTGAFGAEGADAGGEPGADRLVRDEEAGLADRDDGEGVPRDQVGVVAGGADEDLGLLEVGVLDAGPAGFGGNGFGFNNLFYPLVGRTCAWEIPGAPNSDYRTGQSQF